MLQPFRVTFLGQRNLAGPSPLQAYCIPCSSSAHRAPCKKATAPIYKVKRNDPRCGSTCTRVAGSDWANWCRMLIICAAIEIARRGHSTTALSMGTYILARRSRYLFCGVCRSSLNFRALRPSTFIWCCPLGLCRFSCSGTNVTTTAWTLKERENVKLCFNLT